jgi:hypothetical protein
MLHYNGLIFGLIAFLIIGIFHPVVAKTEYYFGKKIWWIFLLTGIVFSGWSLLLVNNFASLATGVTGFGLFWSTHELFKQHQRVLTGRAKRNPNRTYVSGILLTCLPTAYHLNYIGIEAGAASFLIIAVSRYLTIKAEYYFSKKFWVAFLFIGIGSAIGSLFIETLIGSVILGINGFTFLWGIGEIIDQEGRVKKGWFPKNPKRTY